MPARQFDLNHGDGKAAAPAVEPLLFAMARDPHTLFVYWNIDWPTEFAAEAPLDRQVHLRVNTGGGTAESESLIEPLLGTFYAPVAQAGGAYRADLGYYNRTGRWHSVAQSDLIEMPPEGMSEDTSVDVATVPFHLSFQRLVDLFRDSNADPLAAALARVQARAIEVENDKELAPNERQILREMKLSLEELRTSHQALVERTRDESFRRRAEAILGFGPTSPTHGFSSTGGS